VLARIADRLGIPLEEFQALDPRISPEVKEWMEDEPRVGQLLRRLQDSPDRDRLLRRIEGVIRDDKQSEEL